MKKQFLLLIGFLTIGITAFGQVASTDGTFTASGATNLALRTSSTPTTRLTILGSGTSVGFVGINTSSPTDLLHVNSGNVRASQFNATNGIFNTIGASTNLSLNTNNVVRMTLLAASGNVGIGTASPADLLHVTGSSRANQFNATNGIFNTIGASTNFSLNTNSVPRMTVLASSGNIGIGTITPADLLDVSGNSRAVQFNSTNGIFNTVGATNFSLNANSTTRMTILNSNGFVGINKTLPAYQLDVNGSINATGLLINGVAIGGGSQWTTTGANISYSAGNVALGTTTPTAKLHILNAGVGLNGGLLTQSTLASSYASADFKNDSNDLLQVLMGGSTFSNGMMNSRQAALVSGAPNGLSIISYDPNGFITFGSGGLGLTNERMRIDKLGNVGIGAATPLTRLQVNINGSSTNYATAGYADLGLFLQNTNATDNNLNIISFGDASGNGVVNVGSITNHTNHTGKLFFATRPIGSGPVQSKHPMKKVPVALLIPIFKAVKFLPKSRLRLVMLKRIMSMTT